MTDLIQQPQIALFPTERPPSRTNFVRDSIAAWSAYQATGLHVTAEEADHWLAKLESGLEVAPPLPIGLLTRSREA